MIIGNCYIKETPNLKLSVQSTVIRLQNNFYYSLQVKLPSANYTSTDRGTTQLAILLLNIEENCGTNFGLWFDQIYLSGSQQKISKRWTIKRPERCE